MIEGDGRREWVCAWEMAGTCNMRNPLELERSSRASHRVVTPIQGSAMAKQGEGQYPCGMLE